MQTASNWKSLKQSKLGGGHLIFIFRREFPKGNVDTPLHTINTKHHVLNRKMNLFVSLKPDTCKCKNQK